LADWLKQETEKIGHGFVKYAIVLAQTRDWFY